jgi:hypothetical protein
LDWAILECARAGAQGDASEVSRGKRVGHVTGGWPMRPTRAGSAGKRRGTVLDAAGERSGPRRREAFHLLLRVTGRGQLTYLGGKLGFWAVLIKVKRRETLPCTSLVRPAAFKKVIVTTVDCLLCML